MEGKLKPKRIRGVKKCSPGGNKRTESHATSPAYNEGHAAQFIEPPTTDHSNQAPPLNAKPSQKRYLLDGYRSEDALGPIRNSLMNRCIMATESELAPSRVLAVDRVPSDSRDMESVPTKS
jgi:hypothetical protein